MNPKLRRFRTAPGWALVVGWMVGTGLCPAASMTSAEAAGRALVQRVLELVPVEAQTNHGTFLVRPPRGAGPPLELPVRIAIYPVSQGWGSLYEVGPTSDGLRFRLWIERLTDTPPRYFQAQAGPGEPMPAAGQPLPPKARMEPFAGTDFWPADLGMEFLYWPRQRLIRSEMRRGQFCDVLESEDPSEPATGYQRVRAWFDRDTGGLVYAEACDTHGKMLKEFLPRVFRKIEGRWEVTELEMIHRQTGSRTRLILQPGKVSLDRPPPR